jgi:hypothetical protein
MGKKQRDCADCSAPVGYRNRGHCCLCWRRRKEQAARRVCPNCGLDRVLLAETGRVRGVFAPVCRVWTDRAAPTPGPVHPMPPSLAAEEREAAVPSLRQVRLLARPDRMVRSVLASRRADQAARAVRGLR